MKKKMFDFVIGNPPYQEDSNTHATSNSDKSLYDLFMDAAYNVSDKVELITPARFLFNAGYTSKKWNEKMLNDPHFKVLAYEPKSSKVFPNTDIKGGVAISYRDENKDFGAIQAFTAFPELNSIKNKVFSEEINSFSEIIHNRGLYRYSNQAYEDEPDELAKTADARIAPSAFERMPDIFTETKPNDSNEYIQILGLLKGQRCYRWIKRKFVKEVDNLIKYKVFVPKANGSGALGEVLSTPLIGEPLIGEPLIGATETFLSIGDFDSKDTAENCMKYIKTKFARVMLGILKVTQNNPSTTWKFVPLQDFTSSSDIDWSVSIPEIDKQLYAKYGLSEEEISFIETNVKEMV